LSTPLDAALYAQSKDFIRSRRDRNAQAGIGAVGAFGDALAGMSGAEARARWGPQTPGMDPAAKAALVKDLNDQLAKIADAESKLKLEGDKLSSEERIKLAQQKHDARAAALALKAKELEVKGDMAKARMTAQLAAIEHDKAAMADMLPGRITPQIREKAAQWAQTNLPATSGGVDPQSGIMAQLTGAPGAGLLGGALDTGRAADLAAQVAGMSPGEKSAFLDAIAESAGVDPDTLMAGLNDLAKAGDANSVMLLREYQQDKSIVQTKQGEYAEDSKRWADDVRDIARKTGVSLNEKEAKEFADQFGGGEGVEVAGGEKSSGDPADPSGEQKPSPYDDAKARVQDQLDALENDSNEPELIQKKRAIMASPKFQAWMQENQQTDPEMAFKMLIREARPAMRSEKQAGRAIASDRRKEAGLPTLPDPLRPSMPREMAGTLPTEIKDRLAGVEKKRKAEEDAFRESLRQQGFQMPA
jgi:hypothetical protein